jgi:hypothetical protein
MPKFRVPVRVGVAPVQSYERFVVVDAADRRAAAIFISENISTLIHRPGWRVVGRRLAAIRPDRTTYDTYLDYHELEEWVGDGKKIW